MRALIMTITVLFATPALAQTAGTVFPNNQDTANRPAEQTMQQVGGESTGPGVNVQNLSVKPPPKISHTVQTRTTRPKGGRAKPAGPVQH